jgi:hypothetical protein
MAQADREGKGARRSSLSFRGCAEGVKIHDPKPFRLAEAASLCTFRSVW